MKTAYRDAVTWLSGVRRIGVKPGLESIRELLARLGNPQVALRFVHVAGTNGKGSVCAMIESVLRAARVRTGLYTSPHLVTLRERVRIAGDLIGHEATLAGLDRVRTAAEEMARDRGLTASFFEVTTALAALAFRDADVDVAVWETGMGGRLDATNALVSSLDGQRQETSGVSIDEEMINLFKYQRAYEAAARIITAADEMLDTLINCVGVVGR